MTARCDQCRNKIRGPVRHTPTRQLCDRCYDRFAGQAAGLMSGGTVGSALSVGGWYERIRKITNPNRNGRR